MSAYVVCLDSENAKVIQLEKGADQSKALHRHEVRHHTSADANHHKNDEKFFHEVAATLKDATQILLMGPGLAKDHFKKHLETHHHVQLGKHVVGSIGTDPHHTSEAEILKHAHEFFRKFDIYNA